MQEFVKKNAPTFTAAAQSAICPGWFFDDAD
jgi:hypothetical protein